MKIIIVFCLIIFIGGVAMADNASVSSSKDKPENTQSAYKPDPSEKSM